MTSLSTAQTGDDLLTALADINPDDRAVALAAAWLHVLREAADLCGVSYADDMSRQQAITAIVENF
jgi:hypothetical protein